MSDVSVKLANSRRSLDKVTYTPLILPDSTEGGSAIEIIGAVDRLGLIPGEANAARRASPSQRVEDALGALEALSDAANASDRLRAAGRLSRISTAVLSETVALIGLQRQTVLSGTLSAYVALTRRYLAVERSPAPVPAPGIVHPPLEDQLREHTSVAALLPLSITPARTDSIGGGTGPRFLSLAPIRSAVNAAVSSALPGALTAQAQVPKKVADRLGTGVAEWVVAAVGWAEVNDPQALTRIVDGTVDVVAATMRTNATTLLMEGLGFLIDQVQRTAPVVSHLTQRNLQPIGLLHLERIVITPLEIERGELVYSLPLAPGERVTLAHKEWAVREEEYSRLVEDYFQNYSEKGVAETTDMAIASRSETEHSKTLSMTKPATSGATTIADPIEAKSTSIDVTKEIQSQQTSRRETREVTQKASTLSARDQKISFTVNTVSGVEDFTARLYENKLADKVMIIDYFRRMRMWQNALYRTGIRLTYDVVLPDPGRWLRERWSEIRSIDEQLSTPFEFQVMPAPVGATRFDVGLVDFDEMSIDVLEKLARAYAVMLPESPDAIQAVEEKHVIEPSAPGHPVAFSVSLKIDVNYSPTKIWIGGLVAPGSGANAQVIGEYWTQEINIKAGEGFQQTELQLRSRLPSEINIGFTAYEGAVGEVRVWADVKPTAAAWRKWRATVWGLLRQGAYTQYNERRDLLRQRRTAILKDLEATDALTLRRMEREQVMHLVLDWLFPEFAESGKVYRDAARQKPASWEPAMEYGEYIKFVHQAIDWDRALVLLYPYFWDNPDNHTDKLYLDHPDRAHREFLRAGAARVILAIRPGFEEEVISLLDKGEFGRLAPESRFGRIVEQVRAANQDFDRIHESGFAEIVEEGGSPPLSSPSETGILIGEWFDWTPTSALDIDVRLKPLSVET